MPWLAYDGISCCTIICRPRLILPTSLLDTAAGWYVFTDPCMMALTLHVCSILLDEHGLPSLTALQLMWLMLTWNAWCGMHCMVATVLFWAALPIQSSFCYLHAGLSRWQDVTVYQGLSATSAQSRPHWAEQKRGKQHRCTQAKALLNARVQHTEWHNNCTVHCARMKIMFFAVLLHIIANATADCKVIAAAMRAATDLYIYVQAL